MAKSASAQARARASTRVVEQGLRQLPIASFADWDRVWQIRQTLVAFEAGSNFNEAAMLADGMLRDDRINGVTATRASALVGSDMDFRGADNRRKSIKIAETLGGSDEEPGLWDRICPPWVAAEMVVWGFFLGIAVAEIVWDTSDPRRWLPTLRVWHPQFLRYDWNTERFLLQTGEEQNTQVTLPNIEEQPRSDGHWVIWCPYGYRNVWRRALIRPLAMPYLCRQWSYRDWARYNEKHGSPTDLLKVPEGAPEEEKALVQQQLANRGSDATIALPQGMPNEPGYDLSILEATGNSYASFKDQIAKLETDIAVVVLGQNLTTEVQGGSRAAAQIHEAVRLDKLREDSRIAACLRDQVLTWWCEHNYGDAALTPRVSYIVDPPEDELQEAQTMEAVGAGLSALQLAGINVDADAVAERFGIPREAVELTEEGDVVPSVPETLDLTPSAISAIVRVNEARAATGLGPLLTETGAPDPDGELTVAAYMAKVSDVVAAAAAAEAGQAEPTDPNKPAPAPVVHVGGNPPTSAGADDGSSADTSADAIEPLSVRANSYARARAQIEEAKAMSREIALRARQALRQGRATTPGRKRLQKYADALHQLGAERGRQAMKADLAELMAEVEKSGGDLATLKKRIVARYKHKMSGEALAKVVERANIMAALAGRQGALEDL